VVIVPVEVARSASAIALSKAMVSPSGRVRPKRGDDGSTMRPSGLARADIRAISSSPNSNPNTSMFPGAMCASVPDFWIAITPACWTCHRMTI
jgi:hypothetical protein